jgi:hypothetical protein
MSYHTRMFLRMSLPALAICLASIVLATAAGLFGGALSALGGPPEWAGLGNAIALGGLVLSLLVYGFQTFRYWRWTLGEGECCYVCGCLLGREREGRFGPYRRCLGCGKNHSLSHTFS